MLRLPFTAIDDNRHFMQTRVVLAGGNYFKTLPAHDRGLFTRFKLPFTDLKYLL
jgi:hypothetical protein